VEFCGIDDRADEGKEKVSVATSYLEKSIEVFFFRECLGHI
jgi:hypothetical protein